jgi:hypothetical protein
MSLEPVPELNTAFPQYTEKYFVAMIIDNVVYEVINVNGQSAAKFMRQPSFVQINVGDAVVGSVYNPETGTFTIPGRDA